MTSIPPYIWNKNKWARCKKNWKKMFFPTIIIMIYFFVSIMFGSNIAYSLKNLINPDNLKINSCKPPFSNKTKFPYNLCPKGDTPFGDVTNPCFAPLIWFLQTLGFSWIRWRKMILMTPKDDLAYEKNPYANAVSPPSVPEGSIKELMLFLILPLAVLLIMIIGPIISIIITYCASFSAYRGMILTFVFTFIFPILLFLIAPILAILQPLEVLYITVFKPFFSGGLGQLIDRLAKFTLIPIICSLPISLMACGALGWQLGAAPTAMLLAYYFKKLFSIGKSNKDTKIVTPTPKLP